MTKQSIKRTKYTFSPDEVQAILAEKAGVTINCEINFRIRHDDGHEPLLMWVDIITETLVRDDPVKAI